MRGGETRPYRRRHHATDVHFTCVYRPRSESVGILSRSRLAPVRRQRFRTRRISKPFRGRSREVERLSTNRRVAVLYVLRSSSNLIFEPRHRDARRTLLRRVVAFLRGIRRKPRGRIDSFWSGPRIAKSRRTAMHGLRWTACRFRGSAGGFYTEREGTFGDTWRERRRAWSRSAEFYVVRDSFAPSTTPLKALTTGQRAAVMSTDLFRPPPSPRPRLVT